MNSLICRILFLSSVLLAAQAILAQPATPDKTAPKSTSKVNVKYDRSKDVTTVSLKSMTVTAPKQEKDVGSTLPLHQMDFEASFSYKGQFAGEPVSDVSLRFKCVAGTYIFLRGQELIMALDRRIPGQDRGFSLGMTSYKSFPPKFNSVYEELMELRVPTDALHKFATAKTVEFFFGPIIYELTQKQHDAVKEFASFLPPSDKIK